MSPGAPSHPRRSLLLGVASDRRRGRDVRRRAATAARSPSTSTTSSTPRRSCSSTGRTRSPARITELEDGQQPHLAAGRRVPRRAASRSSRPARPTGRSRSSGSPRFMLSLRIVGVRDWRVYGAFALWPSVIGEIRVSHLTPFLCLLVALAWRYRDVRFAPGARRRARRRDQVLPLAARRLARRDRRGARDARRRRASPAARSCSSSRSPGSTTTSARCSSSGGTFDQDSYSPFGFLVQIGAPGAARARRDARDRRRAPRRLLAPGEPRPRRRGRARPLADRVARLLRRRRRSRSRSSGRGSRPSGSSPLATWGLLSAGIGAGNGWGSARVLIVFAIVFAVIVRGEREATAQRRQSRRHGTTRGEQAA